MLNLKFASLFFETHPAGTLHRGYSTRRCYSAKVENSQCGAVCHFHAGQTGTPLKFIMEPADEFLEKEISFGDHHSLVPW